MGFIKHTQAEKVAPVTPVENDQLNVEKQRTGSVTLADVAPRTCANPGDCLAPHCACT